MQAEMARIQAQADAQQCIDAGVPLGRGRICKTHARILGALQGVRGLFAARSAVRRDEFAAFFKRKDTFALGVCNGCQMMAALSQVARAELSRRWVEGDSADRAAKARRVYYLSMEFLIGRTLGNALHALNLQGSMAQAARTHATALEDVAGLDVLGYTSQARFLLNAGLLDILTEQVTQTTTREQANMQVAIQKLTSEAEMGELFKVLALGRDIDGSLIGFARGDRRHRL